MFRPQTQKLLRAKAGRLKSMAGKKEISISGTFEVTLRPPPVSQKIVKKKREQAHCCEFKGPKCDLITFGGQGGAGPAGNPGHAAWPANASRRRQGGPAKPRRAHAPREGKIKKKKKN